MKIDVLTLFPEMFTGVISSSIIKRAIDDNKIEINLHNFRDYSKDIHHKVDDTPYGGGCGMILTCQPIFDCVNDLKDDESTVILLTLLTMMRIYLLFVFLMMLIMAVLQNLRLLLLD